MNQGSVQAKERPAGASVQDRGHEAQGARKASGDGQGELITSQGRTTIADAVVAKVAGLAAREIGGVHDMGAGMARAIGTMRERLPGVTGDQGATRGVAVQVGERQAAIDLDLIVEYGASIPDLASAVRENVIGEVEHMCGLDVVEVNIEVADIHLPGEEDSEERPAQTESKVR
ncbi:stress protein [Actinomadura sp. NBRC 104412]|nr:stress protein [Actinomadura sp. NBRC 104412]